MPVQRSRKNTNTDARRAVPGGCSLKQPDKLYKLSDRYLHLELDEFRHADKTCVDEDTRLELIAADVGLPGLVLRLDPDDPPCFRHRQLCNGERAYERIEGLFNSLLAQAAEKSAVSWPTRRQLTFSAFHVWQLGRRPQRGQATKASPTGQRADDA